MADIKKIVLPNGSEFDIKDEAARDSIGNLADVAWSGNYVDLNNIPDSDVFIVNFTKPDSVIIADKTYDEIVEAASAGKAVIGCYGSFQLLLSQNGNAAGNIALKFFSAYYNETTTSSGTIKLIYIPSITYSKSNGISYTLSSQNLSIKLPNYVATSANSGQMLVANSTGTTLEWADVPAAPTAEDMAVVLNMLTNLGLDTTTTLSAASASSVVFGSSVVQRSAQEGSE